MGLASVAAWPFARQPTGPPSEVLPIHLAGLHLTATVTVDPAPSRRHSESRHPIYIFLFVFLTTFTNGLASHPSVRAEELASYKKGLRAQELAS